jgi:putative RNA 2'-phosphotransferase
MTNSHVDITSKSRFLSYVLRHRPDTIGISINSQGWASVPELLTKAAAAVEGTTITLNELKQIVAQNDKKRFVLSDDVTYIRAAQGNSIEVDLKLTVKAPPPIRYHGTVGKFMADILKQGLRPMTRHDVHLSPDKDAATQVAIRRGKPVVLVIQTYPMVRDGFQFRVTSNEVWLISDVPPKYIKFPCSAS